LSVFMPQLPPLLAHSVEPQVHGSTVEIFVPSLMSPLVGDVWCGSLLVRKWICPFASCSQRIFAERFPTLVQRYARMTDRLNETLQAVGVTTNGADAARILASLGMPTTAKTIIRRVLQLALPTAGTVHVAGIDEWAWKKGFHYGNLYLQPEPLRTLITYHS